MLMEPGETHYNTRISGPLDFDVLFIRPTVLEAAVDGIGYRRVVPHFRAAQFYDLDLCRRVTNLISSLRGGANALQVQSEFSSCLRRLLEACAEEPPPTRRTERVTVDRAREYLRERYDQDVTLAELAKVTGVTPCHLVRDFSRVVGLPPHAFQIQLRVARARELIAAGTPLAQAASMVGFVDQSHLHRHFQRIVGVTPGVYAAATARTYKTLLLGPETLSSGESMSRRRRGQSSRSDS
jgi:AraC-like DNA-binding protein